MPTPDINFEKELWDAANEVLNQFSRHREIVNHMPGDSQAAVMTALIGLAEIVMDFWIISQI